jgi:hypothetical protein
MSNDDDALENPFAPRTPSPARGDDGAASVTIDLDAGSDADAAATCENPCADALSLAADGGSVPRADDADVGETRDDARSSSSPREPLFARAMGTLGGVWAAGVGSGGGEDNTKHATTKTKKRPPSDDSLRYPYEDGALGEGLAAFGTSPERVTSARERELERREARVRAREEMLESQARASSFY